MSSILILFLFLCFYIFVLLVKFNNNLKCNILVINIVADVFRQRVPV